MGVLFGALTTARQSAWPATSTGLTQAQRLFRTVYFDLHVDIHKRAQKARYVDAHIVIALGMQSLLLFWRKLMTDIVVEVHGITTSQNLRHPNGLKVAALALVSTVSKENPQFGLAKRIVAVSDHDIGNDLLGLELTEDNTSIEKIDL